MTSPETQRARQLRQRMTGVERRMWAHLRSRQLAGFKFRRQVPLGPYVADFACLSARILIEIDGPVHDEDGGRDITRQAWLEAQGFRVQRFSSEDVYWRLPWVLDVVHAALLEAIPSASAAQRHLPGKRGGGFNMSRHLRDRTS